jgi:hypothetical protein
MTTIEETIKEAKFYSQQLEQGKYTAEPLCHAFDDVVKEFISWYEKHIEDDMR